VKFNSADYETGYWCARSGQPGRFVSASMRVGYQHGAVDRALDSSEVSGDLRDLLRRVSTTHNEWRSAASTSNRDAQSTADLVSRALMERLKSEPALENICPALWARVHVSAGIYLVL
jgi:hypothetical protein